jgi:hypothetical protein
LRGLPVLASLLFLVAATSTRAAERPKVSVRVEVVESTYRSDLRTDELRWIEESAARALVSRLAHQFGFLSFDTADAPLLLSARLEPRDRKNFPETGFRIALERSRGGRLGDPAGVWWSFRPAEAYGMQAIVSKEDFEREIELKLDMVDYGQLMRAALTAVTIATDAELVKEAVIGANGEISSFLGWKIPYLCRELCIDRDSVLVVENTVPVTAVGPTQFAFRARSLRRSGASGEDPLEAQVVGEAEPGQLHLDDLLKAPREAISIQGVRVVEYRRLAEDARCGGAIAPASVTFGDEKGSP